jgi:hypothetical protein
VFVCIFLDIYFSNNLFLSFAIERDDRRRKGKLVSLLFLERERSFGYDKFKLPPPSSLCLFLYLVGRRSLGSLVGDGGMV